MPTRTSEHQIDPGPAVADLQQQLEDLRRERDEIREQQRATAEVLDVVANASDNAEQSLRRIAEITGRLFDASSVAVQIAEGDKWGLTLRVGASSERISTAIPLAHLEITPRYMPSAVYLENRQIHVPDVEDPEAIARWPGVTPARAAGTRTLSGTPLRREGRAIGVLIVHRDRLAPFTPDELDLLQGFADQVAIAVENARLINETREALERQTATADILKVIASSPSDVQPVFEAIAERSKRLVDALSTTVFRLVDGVMHLKAFTAVSPQADAALKALFPAPLSAFSWGEAVRSGEIHLVIDTEAEVDSLRDLARLRGFRSMLFVPLLRDAAPIGLISVTRVEPGAFADNHVALLRTFADQAVIAIQNVQLFDEVEAKTRDLSEALQQQTATAEVLKVISRSVFDLQTVLDTLVESACALCGTRLGLLYLRGDDAFECKAIAGGGIAEASRIFKGRPIRAGRGTAAERVIMTGEVQSITDFFADPDLDPSVREMIRNAAGSESGLGDLRSTLAVR